MKALVAVFFSVIPHILNAQVASMENSYCYRISDKITVMPIYNAVTVFFAEKSSASVQCLLSSSSGVVYRRAVVSDSETVVLDCCGLLPGDYIIKVSIGEKTFCSAIHYK